MFGFVQRAKTIRQCIVTGDVFLQTGLHPCVDASLFLVSFAFDGWKRSTNVVFIVESLLLLVIGVDSVVVVVVVVVVAVVIVACSIHVGHVAVQGGRGFAQGSRTFRSFFTSLGVVFVGGGGVAGGQHIVMGGVGGVAGGGRRGQELARAAQGFRGACAARGGGSFTPPSFSQASGRFRLRRGVVVVVVVVVVGGGGGVRGTGVVAVGDLGTNDGSTGGGGSNCCGSGHDLFGS
jgi:hypothetical protein